jgi:hypothetical protein
MDFRRIGLGVSGLGLGGVNYANSVGANLPNSSEDWISFSVSAIWAVLGVLMGRR